jgi:hypothetical protein
LALTLAAVTSPAHGGALANLQAQSKHIRLRQPIELCVGMARSAACSSTLETAVRSAAAGTSSTRGRLYEALITSHSGFSSGTFGEIHEVAGHALALRINDDPQWKKRAIGLAHDGLPFVRIPESGNREFTFGITPHGLLGFALKGKAD